MSEIIKQKKYCKEEIDLFNSIEDELGEITDFESSRSATDLIFKYKSNGHEELIADSHLSGKMLIQCIIYCSRRFG